MASKVWQQKNTILIVIGVIIILIVFFAFRNNNKNQSASNSKSTSVTIAPSGINYPSGWHEASQIDASDKAAGIVSEATRNDPTASVVVRTDKATLAEGKDISSLPAEVTKKLKDSLNGFNLINASIINIGKTQAIRVNYTDVKGALIYRHTQLIIPTASKSSYLLISSISSDFPQLSTDTDKISQSFAEYVSTHQ